MLESEEHSEQTMTMTPRGEKANATRCESDSRGEELIPGILDEITLNHITTNLRWRDICRLSAVSRDWRHVIRSRQVYNGRVCSQSTEALALVHYATAKDINTMSLCSLIDNSCHRLAPITSKYPSRGIQPRCQILTLAGKVYAFWRRNLMVYVLDLAVQGHWKECASMETHKVNFVCAALNGKIYIFGGAEGLSSDVNRGASVGAEVYDPEENTWSAIKPMPSLRCHHNIAAVGDELVVYGGYNFAFPKSGGTGMRWLKVTNYLEFYHPVKDEWRVVDYPQRPVEEPFVENTFIIDGKFYSVSLLDAHVYDFNGNSWSHLHSFSFTGSVDISEIWTLHILAVDKELLVHGHWRSTQNEADRACLLQSKGFGSQKKEIVWQQPEFSLPCGKGPSKYLGYFVHPVHL